MNLVSPESVGLSSARLERIRPVMQRYVDQQQIAGLVTLIARRGQVAYLEALGWQELETRTPMTPDALFRIYSMTKPITSVAVMMLAEAGQIRLSDPVARYIPAFKDAPVMVARGGFAYDLVPARRPITLHDLLTHTAGLSYGFDLHSALDDLYRQTVGQLMRGPALSLEKWVMALSRLPLAFQPGTGFNYSMAIDVLGYVIQLAAEQPFDAFLREKIFGPLGMVDTDFWVPPEKAHRLAGIYGPAEGGGLKPAETPDGRHHTEPAPAASGGGGLVSTIGDYFRFGQMLLNGGELEGTRLLGRKTVEWMLQNHLPPGVHPDGDPAIGFGLGGSVLLQPGLSHRPGSPGKFGWGGAANTEWWIDPAEELQCLLMLQYVSGVTIPIADDFAQLAYQALE
jgi:CubicO group peptidase (beta-lactamase class C family)